MSSKDKSSVRHFEQSLAELEKIVAQLEAGDMNLEQSMDEFERGVNLTRQLNETLKNAELRVKELAAQMDAKDPETPDTP